MKVGMRTPSIKKSVSAKTTGRINRSAKRAINPMYGKKSMGVINNPKKAAYNYVYNRTTKSIFSGSSRSSTSTNLGDVSQSMYYNVKVSIVLHLLAIILVCTATILTMTFHFFIGLGLAILFVILHTIAKIGDNEIAEHLNGLTKGIVIAMIVILIVSAISGLVGENFELFRSCGKIIVAGLFSVSAFMS